MSTCIFCKIARGEIPAKKIYEDEHIVAFHDIHPQASVHFMIIPKEHIANLYEAGPEHAAALSAMLIKAGELAQSQGLHDGFRSIINTGKIGRQEVYHLHLHVLGGTSPLGAMLPKSPH